MINYQIEIIETPEIASETIAALQKKIRNELKKPLCSVDYCLIDLCIDKILYLSDKFSL